MLGGHETLPIGYPTTLATIGGGLLLGLGAFVTRACVFGAIAKFGSGEWAYVLTPIGFYLGCLTIWPLIGKFPTMHVASPLFAASWLLLPGLWCRIDPCPRDYPAFTGNPLALAMVLLPAAAVWLRRRHG